MDELIKISDVIKICKRFTLYNNNGTTAFFNKASFADLLRTSAVNVDKYVPQWIAVKDRLPECGVNVLVTFVNRILGEAFVGVMVLFDDGWCWYQTDDAINKNLEITHWMPLPERPKENE